MDSVEEHRRLTEQHRRAGFTISTVEMVQVGRKPSGSKIWKVVPHSYRCVPLLLLLLIVWSDR